MTIYIALKDDYLTIEDVKDFGVMRHMFQGKRQKILYVHYTWTEDTMIIPFKEITEFHVK